MRPPCQSIFSVSIIQTAAAQNSGKSLLRHAGQAFHALFIATVISILHTGRLYFKNTIHRRMHPLLIIKRVRRLTHGPLILHRLINRRRPLALLNFGHHLRHVDSGNFFGDLHDFRIADLTLFPGGPLKQFIQTADKCRFLVRDIQTQIAKFRFNHGF